MPRTMIALVAVAIATPAFAERQSDAQLKAQVGLFVLVLLLTRAHARLKRWPPAYVGQQLNRNANRDYR